MQESKPQKFGEKFLEKYKMNLSINLFRIESIADFPRYAKMYRDDGVGKQYTLVNFINSIII